MLTPKQLEDISEQVRRLSKTHPLRVKRLQELVEEARSAHINLILTEMNLMNELHLVTESESDG